MERTCKKCGETKPIEEFVKRANSKYVRYSCKLCANKNGKLANKKFYKNHKNQINEGCRNYYNEHKKRINQRSLQYISNKMKSDPIFRAKRNALHRKIDNKCTALLYDRYVANNIRLLTGISVRVIQQHPELIECKRLIIKIKRLANENSNRT